MEATANSGNDTAAFGPAILPPAPQPQLPRPKPIEATASSVPAVAPVILVLDKTAVEGPRIHEMPVLGAIRKFTFQPGVGTPMPPEIAAKFLKHEDAFAPVNEQGQVLPYTRAPKQLEELQAGEKLNLSEQETVARFDELSSPSLYRRCVELPGGEKFSQGDRPDRGGMIVFLMAAAKAKRNQGKTAASDVGPDDFVPEAADGDEAQTFDQYAEHRDDDGED